MSAVIEVTLRLLAPLPIEHTAKDGRMCVLEARDLHAHGVHVMLRIAPNTEGYFVMGRTTRADLDRDLYQAGFALPYEPRANVYRFFMAMVRDGRAELLAGPHCRLPTRRRLRRAVVP